MGGGGYGAMEVTSHLCSASGSSKMIFSIEKYQKTALLGALDIYRFPSLCTAPSPLLRICKDHPMDHPIQASSANLILVLKLPLLLRGVYDALEVIGHLCTAHQDLKKLPWLIEWIRRKTALWAALQISRSPSLWPLSPLWISKDF